MSEEKKGFFKKLISGLSKTRDNIVSGVESIFTGFSHIDDDFYEELEEILIMGDIGVNTTMEIIDKLKAKVKEIEVKWKKQAKSINGYQIQYSTNRKFTDKKTKIKTVAKNKTTKLIVSKLKGKKKYYVHIRTYKIVKGKKYYSSWSKVKVVITKK